MKQTKLFKNLNRIGITSFDYQKPDNHNGFENGGGNSIEFDIVYSDEYITLDDVAKIFRYTNILRYGTTDSNEFYKNHDAIYVDFEEVERAWFTQMQFGVLCNRVIFDNTHKRIIFTLYKNHDITMDYHVSLIIPYSEFFKPNYDKLPLCVINDMHYKIPMYDQSKICVDINTKDYDEMILKNESLWADLPLWISSESENLELCDNIHFNPEHIIKGGRNAYVNSKRQMIDYIKREDIDYYIDYLLKRNPKYSYILDSSRAYQCQEYMKDSNARKASTVKTS